MFNRLFIFVSLFSSSFLQAAPSCGKHEILTYKAKIAKNKSMNPGYSFVKLDKNNNILCEDHYEGNKKLYPASSIKTLIAISLLKKVDRESINLNNKYKITQTNANKECEKYDCKHWGLDVEHSLRDLIRSMIVDSNNIATNQLIDLVGKEFINKFAKSIGALQTGVVRKLYSNYPAEPEITERNFSTSKDLTKIYRFLISNKENHSLSNKSKNLIMKFLKIQKYKDRINRHFPSELVFFHKTGSTSRSSSDAGFYIDSEGNTVVVSALQESKHKIIGKRWDFNLLADLGFELIQ